MAPDADAGKSTGQRADPFAPMLDTIIAGLKKRGMCFGLVPDTGYSPK